MLQNNINTTINCKPVNIVWIERGILLTIIYFVLKYYDILKYKIIIVDNALYCEFLNYIFKKLIFKKFKKHKSYNFYFNIRKIIKKQDIIIDYIHNYDNTIDTDKLYLVPWYDMNDILVAYKYDKHESVKVKKYKRFIDGFSKCRRGNYNNVIWDMFIEFEIYKKYMNFNRHFNVMDIFNSMNDIIESNYTNTIEKKYYYIPVENNISTYIQPNMNSVQNNEIVNKNDNNNAVTDLLKIMNNKLKSLGNV
jgi:hypothetical protein